MRDEKGDLVLNAKGDEQRETDANKIEQIKCDFEAKKIEYTEELRLHNDELRQFEDNEEKAHSRLVENYCSTLVKHRIEEKSDFETNVRNNPIATLDRIREHMCAPA